MNDRNPDRLSESVPAEEFKDNTIDFIERMPQSEKIGMMHRKLSEFHEQSFRYNEARSLIVASDKQSDTPTGYALDAMPLDAYEMGWAFRLYIGEYDKNKGVRVDNSEVYELYNAHQTKQLAHYTKLEGGNRARIEPGSPEADAIDGKLQEIMSSYEWYEYMESCRENKQRKLSQRIGRLIGRNG